MHGKICSGFYFPNFVAIYSMLIPEISFCDFYVILKE